jgi:hypothetical protein
MVQAGIHRHLSSLIPSCSCHLWKLPSCLTLVKSDLTMCGLYLATRCQMLTMVGGRWVLMNQASEVKWLLLGEQAPE